MHSWAHFIHFVVVRAQTARPKHAKSPWKRGVSHLGPPPDHPFFDHDRPQDRFLIFSTHPRGQTTFVKRGQGGGWQWIAERYTKPELSAPSFFSFFHYFFLIHF